jgi:hypothetical protein
VLDVGPLSNIRKEKLRFEAPRGFGGMRWPRKVKEKKFVIKPRGHRRPPKPFGYFSVMKSNVKDIQII